MSAPPGRNDVIHSILGIDDNSSIARQRTKKPEQIEALQAYYDAIFDPEPISSDQLSVASRALVAIRVAAHTGSSAVVAWYSDLARESGATDHQITLAANKSTSWNGDSALEASMQRADMITLDPSSATSAHITKLTQAGLTPAAILSLSQVIAFVSYQVRFVAVLRAIGGLA